MVFRGLATILCPQYVESDVAMVLVSASFRESSSLYLLIGEKLQVTCSPRIPE
jgi:hypothetical protein